MNAYVTNIQRFSLNDGPGIRTTVFLQGCNLHCAWCHNPETLSARPVLMHYPSKCIGCGKCLEVCPNKAHKLAADGTHIIDRSLCTSCGACAASCYASALVMSSSPCSPSDVMKDVIQDKLYYDLSGGGVTVSGGEAALHPQFVIELARLCHEQGIKIAYETSMSVPFARMEEMLRSMDLIMCDMKLADSPTHKRYTGTDNQMIFNNIGRTSKLGRPMIVRTPLIPGVTDSLDNLRSIASYISKMDNILYYELLNFNPLGSAKRIAMDAPDSFADAKSLSKDQLEAIREGLSDIDIAIRIS